MLSDKNNINGSEAYSVMPKGKLSLHKQEIQKHYDSFLLQKEENGDKGSFTTDSWISYN